jgi:hypothetical protein
MDSSYDDEDVPENTYPDSNGPMEGADNSPRLPDQGAVNLNQDVLVPTYVISNPEDANAEDIPNELESGGDLEAGSPISSPTRIEAGSSLLPVSESTQIRMEEVSSLLLASESTQTRMEEGSSLLLASLSSGMRVEEGSEDVMSVEYDGVSAVINLLNDLLTQNVGQYPNGRKWINNRNWFSSP